MKKDYFDAIFKRKSFHLFRNVAFESISSKELSDIIEAYEDFEKLVPDIKTDIRIVKASEVTLKRDSEYAILIYSEKKDNYLMNAGYIGEQLDLYLVSHNIGSLWYGIGKPDIEKYNGLDFVIMFLVRKISDDSKYRKDMYKSKRKPLEEIWKGDDLSIADIARFSPSACNSQPWFVKNENGILTIYRYRKKGRIGIMPSHAVSYFNRIDVGIYISILEICLEHNNIKYSRKLFVDDGSDNEYTKSAEYIIE